MYQTSASVAWLGRLGLISGLAWSKTQAKQKTKPSHQLFFGFKAKPQKFAGLPRSDMYNIFFKLYKEFYNKFEVNDQNA
jgi:hypothetical protein